MHIITPDNYNVHIYVLEQNLDLKFHGGSPIIPSADMQKVLLKNKYIVFRLFSLIKTNLVSTFSMRVCY